jgi:hypothetical protein
LLETQIINAGSTGCHSIHGAMKERRTAGYLPSRILPSVFSLRMRRLVRGTSN